MKRITATVLVAFGLLGAAGCGGDDKDGGTAGGGGGAEATPAQTEAPSFKAGYQSISKDLEGIGGDLETAITSASEKSNDELATEFGDLAARTRDVADGLAGLTPPDDLADEVDGLQAAVEKGATDLEGIVEAAKTGDVEKATDSTKALIADSPAISDGRAELDKAVASLSE